MAYGTPTGISNTDYYGFVAEKIGALSVGGTKFPVTNATPVGPTGDMFVELI